MFRKKKPEKQELKNFLFQKMLNALAVFEPVYNPDGDFISCRFTYVNNEFERLTGLKNDSVKGSTIHEVWPDIQEAWIERFRKVSVDGQEQMFDLYNKPMDKVLRCKTFSPLAGQNNFYVLLEDITGIKEIEEKLFLQESILNFAIEQLPLPVIIAENPDIRITRFNKLAEELLAEPADIKNIKLTEHRKYWPTFYPDGTPYKVEDFPLIRAIKKGETIRGEEILLRGGGEDRWLSVSAVPLYDEKGQIRAGIVIFPEITEIKRRELDLKKKDYILELITNNVTDFISLATFSADPVYVYVSPSYANILGYSSEELVGTSSLAMFNPEDVKVLKELLRKYLEYDKKGKFEKPITIITEKIEYRLRKKGGGWCYVESNVSLADNKLVFVSRDISSKKKNEKRIKHLNRVLLSIRGVNQLIVREKDINKLIEGVCQHLYENGGYGNVLISLLDEEKGYGKGQISRQDGKTGGYKCQRIALEKKELVVFSDVSSDCSDCGLLKDCNGQVAFCAPLCYMDKVYGTITVSLPEDLGDQKEEQELFSELAGDLGFSIFSINAAGEQEKIRKEREKHIHELEVFYKAAMDREERILELKKEIERLRKDRGEQDIV